MTQRPRTMEHRALLYRDAVDVIGEEYAGVLELEDVARRIAASRRQLQRAFAEVGGTTFRAELTRVRLERGAEMLRASDSTVRTVADRVGYRQAAQFAKAFRRHFDMSPLEYRRAARANGREPRPAAHASTRSPAGQAGTPAF